MKMKRTLAALMVAATMTATAAAMPLSVFAEGIDPPPSETPTASTATSSIKITKPTNDEATHEYRAYQIFKGDLSGDSLLNINWGDNVDSSKIIPELLKLKKADNETLVFAGKTAETLTPSDVAKALQIPENKTVGDISADAFAALLKSTAGALKSTPAPKTGASAEEIDVSDVGTGYYLVDDYISTKTKPYAYSKTIMQTLGKKEINAKTDVPSIGKKIGEDYTSGVVANTASIGDTVPFVLQTAVPDMKDFNDYYFIINDKMCDGLTFDATSVSIIIDGYNLDTESGKPAPLSSTNDYEVQTGTNAEGYTFQIVFKDFYEKLYTDDGQYTGKTITVKYNATLNANADRSSLGNENEVDLTFSNNPNHTYGGTDEPSETEKENDDVIGKTPESVTKTYTTNLKLIKVDADDNTKTLKGAEFEITGNGINQSVLVMASEVYTENEAGTYYKLKDGTYTQKDPATLSASVVEAKYDDTTKKYKLESVAATKNTEGSVGNKITATVSDDGVLIFGGLGEGKYTITETKAPDGGYNKLTNSIEVVIDATASLASVAWTYTGATVAADGIATVTIENSKGIVLPGTGGIGTTLFYTLGSLLIATAAAMVITKKRMEVKEK